MFRVICELGIVYAVASTPTNAAIMARMLQAKHGAIFHIVRVG
jgi:hypothetical protein